MIYGAAEIIDNRIPLIFCVIINQHLSKAEAPMYWTLVQYERRWRKGFQISRFSKGGVDPETLTLTPD